MKKKVIKKTFIVFCIAGTVAMIISGCSSFDGSDTSEETIVVTEESVIETENSSAAQEKIANLEFDHEIIMDKSEFLCIDAYKDGYYVINSHKGDQLQQILVVPEGKTAPEEIGKDIIIIRQPVTSSKIDSVSLLTLLGDLDESLLDKVTLTAVDKDNIYSDKIRDNIDKNVTKYTGATDKPDLNLVKEAAPQVYLCNPGLKKEPVYEEYQKLGITPFVTYLHQETDPLGRIEWMKALGVIYGDIEQSESFYEAQKAAAESVDKSKAEGKTYAMICFRKKDNKAFVRRTGDPIAKIGELAGGSNVLSDVPKTAWEEMSIDDFAEHFKDTDYLIYLDKHGDNVASLEELNGISDKISGLKAVKNGNVWRTRTDYMQMNNVGDMAKELNGIFAGDEEVINTVTDFLKVD